MELSDATEKSPAIPGLDPENFRLVAQCLNHYASPGPSYPLSFYKFHNILSVYGSIQFFVISNSPSLNLLYLIILDVESFGAPITLNNTHTHTHSVGFLWTRDRPVA